MIPTLIVLGLLALGVGIVAFATRRPPSRLEAPRADTDTAWNDPIAPARSPTVADNPFAHAPEPDVEPVRPKPAPAERA
jgi:hypothetical protein